MEAFNSGQRNNDDFAIRIGANNEFLPRVLGWNAIQLYELKVLNEGYYTGEQDRIGCRGRRRRLHRLDEIDRR